MVIVIMIFEILGKPKEYVKEALEKHMSKLDEIKSVSVIDKKINEPKKIKDDKQGLYTCFSEVELKCDSLKTLSDIVFNFMPSSVEVIDPDKITLNCEEATNLFTELIVKLHKYDEIAKLSQGRIHQLTKQLKAALKVLNDNNLIKYGKIVDKKD